MSEAPGGDSPLLVFGRAVSTAASHWRLAILLWLPSFLVALLTTFSVVGTAQQMAASTDMAETVASGGWIAVALELALALNAAPSMAGAEESRSLLFSAAIGALVALAAVPVNGLLYTFLAGGVLERLAGRETAFAQACRRWFWPMLRFGLAAVLVFGAASVMAAGALIAIPGGSLFNDGLRALLFATWLTIVNGWLTLARADMVVREDRRALAALARAFRAMVRPAGAMLWLAVGLLSGMHATLAGSALLGVSAMEVAAAAVAFQVAALTGAWLKLLQLALGVELARVTSA